MGTESIVQVLQGLTLRNTHTHTHKEQKKEKCDIVILFSHRSHTSFAFLSLAFLTSAFSFFISTISETWPFSSNGIWYQLEI